MSAGFYKLMGLLSTIMKKRLDILLVERGLAATRTKAAEMVKTGFVSATCGGKLTKPGQEVPIDIELDIIQNEQWVSRAALKLNHAITHWNIDINSKTCLDLGASTGGFCEVLLKNGAAKIYAVDVGHGQLNPAIAANPKIISLEKTNCKDLNKKLIPDAIDLITCDLSFISLEKALPAALELGNELIALIKPQFEVGKENIGSGIVKSEKLHAKVCAQIKDWLGSRNWLVSGIIDSPIIGGSGNKEFLIHATRSL